MGNCKDCASWRHYESIHGEKFNYCDAVEFADGNAPVGSADFSLYATAHDDSGLLVHLKTGPTFGCVQFKLANPAKG